MIPSIPYWGERGEPEVQDFGVGMPMGNGLLVYKSIIMTSQDPSRVYLSLHLFVMELDHQNAPTFWALLQVATDAEPKSTPY